MFRSIGDITKKIIDIETDNKLFNWQINEVFIWEIIRYKIYLAITDTAFENKIEQNNLSRRSLRIFSKIKNKSFKFLNAIIYHPFFDRTKCDALIFESSRKLLFDKEYIDPYTKFTRDELIKSGTNVSVYRSSYNYDKLAKKNLKIKHLDLVYMLSGFRAWFTKTQIGKTEQKNILDLQKILKTELNFDIDLLNLIEREINLFKKKSGYFEDILKRKDPKKIYIVNFCDKPALIAKAKERKIQVIDIQHGLISSDDIIYHYPNVAEESLHYFPDRLYAWSPVWQKVCKLPLKNEHIIDYGNKYLQNQRSKYAQVIKNQNQVLIVSQPGLTKTIALEYLKNVSLFSQYDVLYKLHPNEYEQAFNYKELQDLKQEPNIKFIEKHQDLYKIMAESNYVVGVGSTVLIEALSFDCKVALFDLPGVEWMKPFVDGEHVKMASNVFFKS